MTARRVLRDFETPDPLDSGTALHPRTDDLGSDDFGPGVLVPGGSYDGSQAGSADRQEAYPAGDTTGRYSFQTATAWVQGYEARFRPLQGITDSSGQAQGYQSSIQCIATWDWTDPDTGLESFGQVLINVFEKSVDTSEGTAIAPTVSVTEKYIDAGTTVISNDDGVVIDTTQQWFKFNWLPGGDWSIGPLSGAPFLTGSIPQMPHAPAGPTDVVNFGVQVRRLIDISYPGPCLMDNLAIYLGGQPVTRCYPRDDGNGIDGNSRIHPPPKSRRIVGGHL